MTDPDPTPTTIWRYSIKSQLTPHGFREGWAVFLLDSNGMLAVASDYGDYVYHWPRHGWGPEDFRRFLVGIDASYLIGKLSHGKRVPDAEATERNIRKEILQLRREKIMTKDRALSEWELVNRASFDHDVEIHDWYLSTSLTDVLDLFQYQPEPQLVAFTQRVWPRFVAALQEDLTSVPDKTTMPDPAIRDPAAPIVFYDALNSEELNCTSFDDAVAEYLNAVDPEQWPRTLTVRRYRSRVVSQDDVQALAEFILARLLEELDEQYEYGNPDAATVPKPVMQVSARLFVSSVVSEYHVWSTEDAGKREVDLPTWIRGRGREYLDRTEVRNWLSEVEA